MVIVAGDKGFCVGISLFFFFWKVRVSDYAWIIEYPTYWILWVNHKCSSKTKSAKQKANQLSLANYLETDLATKVTQGPKSLQYVPQRPKQVLVPVILFLLVKTEWTSASTLYLSNLSLLYGLSEYSLLSNSNSLIYEFEEL